MKKTKFTVTSLTRADSTSEQPEGVQVVKVDYDDQEALISALQGQQFLAITFSVMAPPELHTKIVEAAGKAGVPYIMMNSYGSDVMNTKLAQDTMYDHAVKKYIPEIESTGASWIAMCCGFWYQWSLALGEPWYGFDIKNKKVTFFDDGKTYINSSTWPQCGRALAALLELPLTGASPCIADWANKPLYFESFRVCQRDMLDSIHRVTGSTDKDWEITYEPTADRYKRGLAELQKGNRTGFVTALYSRVFFPNGDGEFGARHTLANEVLGLPKEDLDDATKDAIEMVNSGWTPF